MIDNGRPVKKKVGYDIQFDNTFHGMKISPSNHVIIFVTISREHLIHLLRMLIFLHPGRQDKKFLNGFHLLIWLIVQATSAQSKQCLLYN